MTHSIESNETVIRNKDAYLQERSAVKKRWEEGIIRGAMRTSGISYRSTSGADAMRVVPSTSNRWHVLVERRRSPMDKLLGRNRTTASDPLVGLVVEVLREQGMEAVQIET